MIRKWVVSCGVWHSKGLYIKQPLFLIHSVHTRTKLDKQRKKAEKMPKTPQQVANDKDALDAKRMELDEAIEQANIANANVERLRREFNELQTVSFYLIIFSRFFLSSRLLDQMWS